VYSLAEPLIVFRFGMDQAVEFVCNGAAAYNLYNRLEEPILRLPARKLPSTSPANAAWSLDRLVTVWQEALSPYLPL